MLTQLENTNTDVLRVSAHLFYNGNGKLKEYKNRNGFKIKCTLDDIENARILPDIRYLKSKDINLQKLALKDSVKLIWPPLNTKSYNDVINYNVTGKDYFDFKLTKNLSEDIMLETGKHRGFMRYGIPSDIDNIESKIGIVLAYHADTQHKLMLSNNLKITKYNDNQWKTDIAIHMDSFPVSSNSALLVKYNDEWVITGNLIGASLVNQPENTDIYNWAQFLSIKSTLQNDGYLLKKRDN